MALTITDRIAKHNQMKARLAEKESKIRLDERKARTRRLIEVGGLLEKAGLADLDNNTLYGALLSLADGASEKVQREKWARLGEKALEREAKAKARDTLPFVLSFPAPVPKETATQLRGAGFRFNKIFKHWEGLSTAEVAQDAAKQFGGTAAAVNGAQS